MRAYVIRRLLQAVAVCLVVSAVSFFLLFFNTDPALLLLPPEVEIEDIEHFKKQMGLDKPVMIQYANFLRKVIFHGDFGKSFATQTPALRVIAERLPATMKLGALALLFGNFFSIIVGITSAIKRYSLIDNASTFLSLLGQAMPNFWLGLMLIIFFGVWLGWFPISGYGTTAHYVLPVITLGTGILPVNMRIVRSGMLEVLNKDYIRTARANGFSEAKVMLKYAFKNACIPLVTVMGMQITMLISGAVLTESVFAWPGVGRLAVQSIRMGDYPVVQATVTIVCIAAVIGNLLADITTALIDPRMRMDK
jgi:peptide/nickel transport system permease protein